MKRHHQDLIKSNLCTLSEYTSNFKRLINKLFEAKLLSEGDLEFIEKHTGPYEKKSQLYMTLIRKPDDNTFETLLKCLQDTENVHVHGILQKAMISTTTDERVWHQVLRPFHSFYGRSAELALMRTFFLAQQKTGSESLSSVLQQVIVIAGITGIGKSELARQFALKYSNDFDNNVIWINGKKMLESFYVLWKDELEARRLEKCNFCQHVVTCVYKFFSTKKCLFIFDNVDGLDDSMSNGVSKFLPQSQSSLESLPYILITSRSRNWEGISVLSLGPLDEEASFKLLESGTTLKKLNEQAPSASAELVELASELKGIPFILQLAVSHINHIGQGPRLHAEDENLVQKYLKMFHEDVEEFYIYKYNLHKLHSNGQSRSFLCWGTTLLDNVQGKDQMAVAHLLRLLASRDSESTSFDQLKREFDDNFAQILAIATNLCLVEITNDWLVNCHPLIKKFYKYEDKVPRSGPDWNLLSSQQQLKGKPKAEFQKLK